MLHIGNKVNNLKEKAVQNKKNNKQTKKQYRNEML